MPTVDSKILVGRENDGIGKRFGHANEASIGEAHRNVGILLDQFHDWFQVLGKCKGNEQSAAAKQCAEIRGTTFSEKVKSLRQNGFARGPRRGHFRRLRHGPVVVSVSATKQRYNKSSINEDVSGHNLWRANIPSFAQLDRSVSHLPIR